MANVISKAEAQLVDAAKNQLMEHFDTVGVIPWEAGTSTHSREWCMIG